MAVHGAVVFVRENVPGYDTTTRALSIATPTSSRSRQSSIRPSFIPVPGFTRIPSPVNVKKGPRAYDPCMTLVFV